MVKPPIAQVLQSHIASKVESNRIPLSRYRHDPFETLHILVQLILTETMMDKSHGMRQLHLEPRILQLYSTSNLPDTPTTIGAVDSPYGAP